MRLTTLAVYLGIVWSSHILLSSHYTQTCRSTFLSALVGHGSIYCTVLDKGLRVLETTPLLLLASARDLFLEHRHHRWDAERFNRHHAHPLGH